MSSPAGGFVLESVFPAGRIRVFEVDDGDGSGPARRCDVQLRSNGEAGSGGKLQRLTPEQMEETIAALQQVLGKMHP